MESSSITSISMKSSARSGFSRLRRPELTNQSLDGLLTDHVSGQIVKRLSGMSNLSQIAQVVVNIEHFATACEELEGVLMGLRFV
jgi:hypothetical protein